MNGWLDSVWPMALAALALVTAVLSAALILVRILRRSAVIRHAVLLWSLIAAGLCPWGLAAARIAAIPAPPAIGKVAISVSNFFDHSARPGGLESGGAAGRGRQFRVSEALLILWAAGALFSLGRMMQGLRATRQLRRGAQPMSARQLELVRGELMAAFGSSLPAVLVSDHATIPMTNGYWPPVVLLPAPLLSKIDDRQLLQVLFHECAHAVRRDTLAILYERLLIAVFWFHPLVRFASMRLDAAREEICDNHVLRAVPAREYSQTLLTIAESISPARNAWFAPALIQPGSLEARIADLLDPRRCIMTRLTSKKVAAIAVGFLGSVMVLSSFAAGPRAPQSSPADFSHVVNLETKGSGDYIKIVEVRGPSDTLTVGNTYEVRGTYRLVSQDKALLMVSVTTEARQPRESHPPLPEQKIVVEKGEGSFTLQFHLWHEGMPHVSFYALPHGNGFATRYF
jgi:beta-lactamase regulating signal transducer with metallopeptidase domain